MPLTKAQIDTTNKMLTGEDVDGIHTDGFEDHFGQLCVMRDNMYALLRVHDMGPGIADANATAILAAAKLEAKVEAEALVTVLS